MRAANNPLTDQYGHGTHVAGLLAAQEDGDGKAQGACSSAKLMPIRFLDRYGAGGVVDAIKGIRWSIDHQAQIINHSWTIRNYSQSLFDVIKEADALGIVQIAAAGNMGGDSDQSAVYPAAFALQLSGVISVGNWDNEQHNLFPGSNYGLTSVDLAASGTNLLSLAPDNSQQIRTGTSMAAPLVCAAAAMLKQQDPSLTAAQIRSMLQLSSHTETQLNNKTRSSGRLNVAAALRQDKNPANLLFVNTNEPFITFNGVGFMPGDDWQFASASLPAKNYSLQPLFISEQQVTFKNQELGNGYWQLYRNGELLNQLAYQPVLAVPSQLQAVSSRSGQLISWRGSTQAEKYLLQAAVDEQGFISIAELSAPVNQFDHLITDYKTIRYRIKASYDYQFTGDDIHTEHSLYSDILNIGAEYLPWQSELIASIPQGADAAIELQVSAKNSGGFFELLDDPDNLITTLDSSGKLYINTEQVLSSVVTLAYNYNNEQSVKLLTLSVHAKPNWILPINSNEQLALTANGFVIHSFQRLIDGNYQIDGVVSEQQPLLSVNLDSLGRQFSAVKVFDSGELLADGQIVIGERQLNINLPFADNNAGSKRIIIDLNLRDKNSSTDSRCFIASSIYPQQPEKLQKLRAFRDHVLLEIPGGEALVSAYYHYSPILVETLKDRPRIKNILKNILDSFI